MDATPETPVLPLVTSDEMQRGEARRRGRAGLFVTLEGPDGSGKTTQLGLLAARLCARGLPVVTLRQPGGTALGDGLRALVVDSRAGAAMSPMTELGLMFADRAQAIAEVIGPALEEGKIVLCDRFTDSTEAYQGGGRELGSEVVLALDQVMCGGLKPDLTLLLLPPLGQALARARGRVAEQAARTGVDEGRFEREGDAFFERVRRAYEAIAMREPERVVSIRDGAGVDAIEARVWGAVEPLLAGRMIEG